MHSHLLHIAQIACWKYDGCKGVEFGINVYPKVITVVVQEDARIYMTNSPAISQFLLLAQVYLSSLSLPTSSTSTSIFSPFFLWFPCRSA